MLQSSNLNQVTIPKQPKLGHGEPLCNQKTPLFIPSASISCLVLYKHRTEFPNGQIFKVACYRNCLIWKTILTVSGASFSHPLTLDAFCG